MDALCQDCLRVVSRDSSRCECGGDVCSCQSCMECVKFLEEGCRDSSRLGLLISLKGLLWSRERGAYGGRSDEPEKA